MKTKVAIVTGGSSGIGRCAAVELQKAGCKVYEFSRRDVPLDGVVHKTVDITNEKSVQLAVAQIVSDCGGVDLLINCAGNGISGAVEFTALADAKAQFEVNFFGMVNVSKAVLPIMRQQRSGRIINVSSVAAVAHIPFQTYYSASKAAIESYTCCLANEVKPFGISVTCVQPGDVATGFTTARQKSADGDDVYHGRISKSVSRMEKDEQGGMAPAFVGRYLKKIAFLRRVKPIYTVGFSYKILSVLCKIMPCRFRNWIVGLLYAK